MNKTLSEIVFAISLASALTGCATTKHSYADKRERVTDPIGNIYLKQERTVQFRDNSECKPNTRNGVVLFQYKGSTGFTLTPTKKPTPVPPEGL